MDLDDSKFDKKVCKLNNLLNATDESYPFREYDIHTYKYDNEIF